MVGPSARTTGLLGYDVVGMTGCQHQTFAVTMSMAAMHWDLDWFAS
jgi:hypothetical protein